VLLGGKDALTVLDNVEPELPVALVVTPQREAGATLLLTARQKQPSEVVPPEGRLALDLLSEDEALALLAASLGRSSTQGLSAEELIAARRIVEALDRHTLAVTLAAAYVADAVGVTLEQLAGQLQDPQRRLQLPKGEAPAEVKRVFASSYAGLPADAQRLFAALATFATPEFGHVAVVALAGALNVVDPEWTVDLLVRRALVTLQGERLRAHPLMQALAAGKFGEWSPVEREQAERAIVEYYAKYAKTTEGLALAPEEPNILGAIEWAQTHAEDQLLTNLCDRMRVFWRDTGRIRTALRYLPWGMEAAERIVATTNEREDWLRQIDLAEFYGDMLIIAGRLDEAEALVLRDLAIIRQQQDRRREAGILVRLGLIARDRRRQEEARAYMEQSLVISRDVGDRLGEAVTLGSLGGVAQDRGRLKEAQDYYDEGLVIMREVGNRRGEGAMLNSLGSVARARGRLKAAQDYYEASLVIVREVGDRRSEGATLNNLGLVARARGRLKAAQDYYEASLVIVREVGNRRGEGAALNNLGSVAQARRRLKEARDCYEASLVIAQETQYAELENAARANLAKLDTMQRKQQVSGE
jgi:tetratricopeptide (TPR) repeat protein